MKTKMNLLFSLMLITAFVLAACGGAATETPAATEAPVVTEAPATAAPTEAPVVEPAGADEAYLDVAGSEALFGLAEDIARDIRRHVHEEIGITASAGVSVNKLVSKVASDAGKPDGLVVVPAGEEAAFLAPRPIRDLPMVGKKTAEVLSGLGIHTIGDIARMPQSALIAKFGSHGAELRARALGIYDALTVSRREDVPRDDDPDRILLGWAARVAEIGLSIAHAEYHKHSAYILQNADMPGFSRMEQQRLARVVLAHRGKLAKVRDAGLEGSDWTLVFALRIASLIHRNRADGKLPFLRVAGEDAGFSMELPQAWLDGNALSAAALETEAEFWRAVGMRFELSGLSDKKVSVLNR